MENLTQEEALALLQGEMNKNELAELLGLSQTTLRQYRNGSRRMKGPQKLLFKLLVSAKQRGRLGEWLTDADRVCISPL